MPAPQKTRNGIGKNQHNMVFIASIQGSAKFLATRSDFENLFSFSQKKILLRKSFFEKRKKILSRKSFFEKRKKILLRNSFFARKIKNLLRKSFFAQKNKNLLRKSFFVKKEKILKIFSRKMKKDCEKRFNFLKSFFENLKLIFFS